ncbi:uncharacterized protein LOC124890987 [Capsicum annuum]|uniref:uncharacterized protein LOC124890987 n=1 Tax=Capsicum annuum TaxID=4072 RepID=UPI001FB10EF9|nr:uncharacterized protein LOC124890987 [Capsicum annuum]
MPEYAKYLRDLVANKVKLQDVEAVALTEEYSFVVTQKMPKKLKDPGKPSSVLWQLANGTIAHPEEVIEDALKKADEQVPINLGYPFLVTGEDLIDVREGAKCRVVVSIPQKTSSNTLIEHPKPQLPKPDMMQIEEPEKAKV